MPTNRDWLEHTEKAAWDTVGALREQVAEARAQADRLTRLSPTLPRIAELIDESREALGIKSQAPAVVIEQLLTRLREASEERDRLEAQVAAARPSAPAAVPPPSAPAEVTTDRGKDLPPAVRRFAKQLAKRLRQRERDDLAEAGGSLAEVAPRVEQRLRDLTPLPYAPGAVGKVAVELGLLALDLARAARRAERG
ncbi:MAG: hypothetical protein RIF41_02185 [Polyangiaceae bacterium]